jgi:hypothetical protein
MVVGQDARGCVVLVPPPRLEFKSGGDTVVSTPLFSYPLGDAYELEPARADSAPLNATNAGK